MQRIYFAGASQEKKKKYWFQFMNITFSEHNYCVLRIFLTKRYLHFWIYCLEILPFQLWCFAWAGWPMVWNETDGQRIRLFNGILNGCLEEKISIFFVQNIALITDIDTSFKEFGLSCFCLLTSNTLLVLNLLQTIELLSFQFVQLGNNVG